MGYPPHTLSATAFRANPSVPFVHHYVRRVPRPCWGGNAVRMTLAVVMDLPVEGVFGVNLLNPQTAIFTFDLQIVNGVPGDCKGVTFSVKGALHQACQNLLFVKAPCSFGPCRCNVTPWGALRWIQGGGILACGGLFAPRSFPAFLPAVFGEGGLV